MTAPHKDDEVDLTVAAGEIGVVGIFGYKRDEHWFKRFKGFILWGLGAIYYRAGSGAGEVKFRGTGENRHRDRFYLVLSGKPTADLPVTAV